MSLSPGSRFGAYDVAAMIGVGGMGEVYRATDPNLKRSVALKVLSESFVSDPNRVARLQREAEMLAALNHGNVAQIYGLEKSGATTALVMELIEGPTLAERIGQGKLPPTEALAIAQQIAAALEAAHEQGIVHRDLKPANVKLKADGTVKVLDFGIAKPLEQRAVSGPQAPALTTPAMTEAGMVLGTAAYMSPEQARGKPVDKRADIWAFGCVLYEMLTGKAAFAGDDITSTLARVLEREPDLAALPKDVPPSVRATLDLCLRKDPRQRLADVRDVKLALAGGLGAPTAAVHTPPLWRRVLPVAAALVIGGLLVSVYERGRQEAPPVVEPAPASVTRFSITPPADAPLASTGAQDVTVSPDGQRVVYVTQTPGTTNFALYVRELDSLEARLVPGTEGLNGNANPFFSPDSRSIAFRHAGRGIMRVSLDGGPPVKIRDDPNSFVGGYWAADGGVILATVLQGRRQLERLSAGGSNQPEPLAATTTPGEFFTEPSLLPGGRAVLFGAAGTGERVEVLDLETGERRTLFDGASPAYVDTGHIVFARGTTLMAVPFDTSELAVTGEPVAFHNVRHQSSGTAADYEVSATGTLVYVPDAGMQGSPREVVWVDRSGREIERAVGDLVDTARDPRLSPDGTRLLLVTGAQTDGDLWVYDLRGRPPIPLALPGDNRFAAWSPDGSRVAFTRVAGNGTTYVTPADGSVMNPLPLRTPPLLAAPYAWTRADELILARSRGNGDIVATPAAPAGEVRDVAVTDAAEFEAALSPDEGLLAYTSDRTGTTEIWAMVYPEGVPVRVSTSGGFEPRWSADGRELYYFVNGAMMAVPVAGGSFGAPVELFRGSYFFANSTAVHSYDVAADGRFLMIRDAGASAAPEAASIVVVENWLEDLAQRFAPAR
jgi:Tol biopolymer transport system component